MATKKAGIDVSEPGKTPANETSRPLIISKGTMLKDPMMADKAEEKSDTPVAQTPPSVVRKKIEPIADQSKQDESKDTEEIIDKPDETIDDSVDTELTDLGPTDPKSDDKADLELEKRQAAVNALVKSRKYAVPIGAVGKRKASERSAVLIAVLILGVIGAIAAIDAGAIDVGYTLPFDIIK